MKKTTLLIFAFATLGAVSSVNAQSGAVPSIQLQEQETIGKQQIKAEELPEGVKQALETDVLKEWEVTEVYKVAPEAVDKAVAVPLYEVYFTNETQQKTIARFDESGNSVATTER